MAPTPSSRAAKEQHQTTPSKTPQSKHRLHFSSLRTPNPSSAARENSVPTEHPVEVIGRVRDHPEKKERPASALDVSEDGRSLRVRTDIGYRDFSLDGVSVAEDEDLGGFYKKFVESRIRDVRLGAKCTVMMYGPTGSGKSHTMFGCSKQPGIVYRALRDILGVGEEEKESSDVDDGGFGVGLFVQIAVLEIYNEEIYDLLSGCNGGGGGVGLPKGNTPKVRLEIMGKKAKNASYITGNEAGKISREVAKVEKRRIVKSTNCNERSSRSHCLIILDVPSVGGRLMLVDMAGSENIEQAGQMGFEAKMQTAKINQGNTALKRVVESIANGDSHVPFRDSKLTMLVQDSFEDDKSKILMILCASPDPKEMHKTISTLEYGAKAKCIVRAAHMSTPKDKMDGSSTVILGSRIAAMNQFICKLQMENKLKQKERDEVQKELLKKEDEVADLRAKIKVMEERHTVAKEVEINTKVDERTLLLRLELKKMEEKVLQQQKELEMLRQQFDKESFPEMVGSRFMKRLSEMAAEEGMEKSMDLDMGDMTTIHDVKEVEDMKISPLNSSLLSSKGQDDDIVMSSFPQKVCLSTVFEGNEEEEEELDRNEEVEVQKEVVEENRSQNNTHILDLIQREIERELELDSQEYAKESSSSRSARIQNIFRLCGNHREIIAHQVQTSTPSKEEEGAEISGNHPTQVANADNLLVVKPQPKEAAAHMQQDLQPYDMTVAESPLSALVRPFSALELSDKKQCSMGTRLGRGLISSDKENNRPDEDAETEGLVDVYVKWETSKEASGNLIKRTRVLANATLSDLRKLIETHFSEENSQQPFTFLLLGDPTGAPLVIDKESSVLVSKLPICNKQLTGHLACLRPTKKKITQHTDHHLPLGPLEKNRLQVAALNSTEVLSPNVGQNMSCLTVV